MSSYKAPFYFLLAMLSVVVCNGQIIIDEQLADWENIEPLHIDDNNSGVDFTKISMTDDERYIYLLLELENEVNLQSDGNITLYFDTDLDAETGYTIGNMGADVYYNFEEKEGRAFINGNDFTIYHNVLELVTLPTVTSTFFEIVIRKNRFVAGLEFLNTNALKVMVRSGFSGDQIPDNDDGIYYEMSNQSFETPTYSIMHPTGENHRVVAWNTLFTGLFDSARSPQFEQVFNGLDADIIGLQEMYDVPESAVKEWFDSRAIGGFTDWNVRHNGNDIFLVSKFPILDDLGVVGNAAFTVNVDGEMWFLIVAHPPCCDNDIGRQNEVDAMMQLLREEKSGDGYFSLTENTPMIIMGDMNFVGFANQRTTLLNGDIDDEIFYGPDFSPDWDGTSLIDANPLTTGLPVSYTWYDENGSFSAGRLDYFIYSDSNLEVQNSFVLNTVNLNDNDLQEYNLAQANTRIASDHLPVVVDIKSTVATSIAIENNQLKWYIGQNNDAQILFMPDAMFNNERIQIYASDGMLAKELKITTGSQSIQLPNDMPKGIYLIQLDDMPSLRWMNQ